MDTQQIPKFDDLLQQIKSKLWLAGINYDTPEICYRFYICIAILTIVASQEVVYLIIYASFDNFLKITQVLPCICTCITTVAKFATLFTKKKEINELTYHIQEIYRNILKDKIKRNLVRKEMVFLKKLIKYLGILNLVLICVYTSSSLFLMFYVYVSKSEVIFDLPFPVAVPCEMDWWLPWLVEYLMSTIAGFYCVLLFVSFDSAYFLLSTTVFINFTVLSDKVRKISGTRCVETLKDMIRSHQHIIRLSEVLDDIFNFPNFINVILGSLQICFLGFTIMMGTWAQIPQSAFLLSSVLLQLLMMSYFGEHIMSESGRVGEAAFQCNWYNMDERSKKMILLLILRAQKPQQLTTFNISKISYASFTGIISKSWSYFSILRTVYKPPDSSSYLASTQQS